MEDLFENFNPLFEGRNGNWDVDLRNFLEFYLQELHNETSCSSMINFSQAAIVLQKSAYVYERKVDYLGQLVMQLLDVLQLSKNSAGTKPSNGDIQEQSPVQETVEPSTSKKGRKSRSNKPYLLEEFSQINNKVSAKCLDLPSVDKTLPKTQHTLTRSAIFGRMVNIKKRRQHELYVFDKNEECMGRKDDFRLSWSLNHCCALVEDPSDESFENPPPVSERLNVPMECDPVVGSLSPVSPGSVGCADECLSDEPVPDTVGHGSNPGSSIQDAPIEHNPNLVPSGNPNQEVLQSQGQNKEVLQGPNPGVSNENRNEEVAEDRNQNVAGPSEPGSSEGFVLPDTPPDSEVMRDAVVVNGEAAIGTSPINNIVLEEEPVSRRILRERNLLKDGERFYSLNYLFSFSLLQSLDDSSDCSSLSIGDKMRHQAQTNRRKGKRRFQEVFDKDKGLAGFEEVEEEPGVPAALSEQVIISELPPEEVPQMNVPVPTPPPTPSNSQAMSPGPVSTPPGSDVPGTPFRRFPETMYTEEPINMFDPCRPNENEQNDRSARVAAWHKSIKQRLDEANARPPFDVHIYGSKVINSFPTVGSTLDFKDIVKGMDRPEIARVFLTSLMLANTENVQISIQDSDNLPVNCMSLTLLSTQRHEAELEAFCAPSGDIQRRNNMESVEPGTSGTQRKRKQEKSANARSIPRKKARAVH